MRSPKAVLLFAASAAMLLGAVPSNAVTFGVSNDGPGNDLQSLLFANGIGSNVITDQVTDLFAPLTPGASVSLDYLFQKNLAAVGVRQFLGYYTDPSVLPTWEVGHLTGGLVTSATFTPGSEFGLAFRSPKFKTDLTKRTNYYTQSALDPDGLTHAVILKDRDANGHLISNSYIVGWEDHFGSANSDFDYNDFVVRLNNVQLAPAAAVPEPGAMAMTLASLTAVWLIRRRKRK